MAIVKLRNKITPKIKFGILLTNLENQLFQFVNPRKLAMEILKENFNIKSNRLIKIEQAITSSGKTISILIIYDYLLKKGDEYRINLDKLEVKDFNFHIYDLRGKEDIDIEELLKNFDSIR